MKKLGDPQVHHDELTGTLLHSHTTQEHPGHPSPHAGSVGVAYTLYVKNSKMSPPFAYLSSLWSETVPIPVAITLTL